MRLPGLPRTQDGVSESQPAALTCSLSTGFSPAMPPLETRSPPVLRLLIGRAQAQTSAVRVSQGPRARLPGPRFIHHPTHTGLLWAHWEPLRTSDGSFSELLCVALKGRQITTWTGRSP